MHKILSLLALLLSFQLSAQTLTQSEIAIGTLGNDAGASIVQITDQGYAITGYSSCSSCPTDVYVAKFDSAFNLIWTRTIGGSNDDYGSSIVQTNDGGIAVAGYTSSYGYGGGGIYIIKLNSSGSLLWSETLQGQNSYSMTKTADKGLAIAGHTAVCSKCSSKMYVLKLDSVGNVIWSEIIGGTSNDTAYSIIQTTDKGYAIAGTTSSFGAGGNDVYVVKLDSTGNLQWSKTIGGTLNDEAYSIVQAKDKGFAIAGITASFGAGANDMYVIKLDTAGNIKWTRTIGGTKNDVANSIIETADGNFVIGGTTNSYKSINYATAIKLDTAGTIIWNRTVIGTTASANSIIQNTNGNYVLTGITSSLGAGGNDACVFLLDTAGNSCTSTKAILGITSKDSGRVSSGGTATTYVPILSIDTSMIDSGGVVTAYCSQTGPTKVITISSNEDKLQVFPNPTASNITLHFSEQAADFMYVRITDILGNTINSFTLNDTQGNDNYTIPTSALAPGLYIIQVSSNEKTLYSKFIKE